MLYILGLWRNVQQQDQVAASKEKKCLVTVKVSLSTYVWNRDEQQGIHFGPNNRKVDQRWSACLDRNVLCQCSTHFLPWNSLQNRGDSSFWFLFLMTIWDVLFFISLTRESKSKGTADMICSCYNVHNSRMQCVSNLMFDVRCNVQMYLIYIYKRNKKSKRN